MTNARQHRLIPHPKADLVLVKPAANKHGMTQRHLHAHDLKMPVPYPQSDLNIVYM